jgi:hypothetical protein
MRRLRLLPWTHPECLLNGLAAAENPRGTARLKLELSIDYYSFDARERLRRRSSL